MKFKKLMTMSLKKLLKRIRRRTMRLRRNRLKMRLRRNRLKMRLRRNLQKLWKNGGPGFFCAVRAVVRWWMTTTPLKRTTGDAK